MVLIMNWFNKLSQIQNVPQYLCHATFRSNVQSIWEKGLLPNHEVCNFNWCEKGVYLCSDLELAKSFVEASENPNISNEQIDNLIVLFIDTATLDKTKLDNDPNMRDEAIGKSCFIYRGIIPPSSIEQFKRRLK